jgi:hypothetical protein
MARVAVGAIGTIEMGGDFPFSPSDEAADQILLPCCVNGRRFFTRNPRLAALHPTHLRRNDVARQYGGASVPSLLTATGA